MVRSDIDSQTLPRPHRADPNVERTVQRVFKKHGIKTPPIPVDRLVVKLGAVFRASRFEGSGGKALRGFYVSKGGGLGTPLIWINTAMSRNAQRSAIAHELAHLLIDQREIHVDRSIVSNRKSGWAEANVDPEERRVGELAAELLLPKHMLVSDLKVEPVAPEDDETLKRLASRYQVSLHAMVARLIQLGLLPAPF